MMTMDKKTESIMKAVGIGTCNLTIMRQTVTNHTTAPQYYVDARGAFNTMQMIT